MQETLTRTLVTSENKISQDPALHGFPSSRETHEEHARLTQHKVVKTGESTRW